MDRALEHGINFFDTANVYGWKLGEGITEQIIGRWLAQGGGRRDKVVLATKVYGKMGDWPNDQGLSARHIIDRLRRRRCAACRPTSSTCTRCTTSPAPRRGTRSGRRWRSWSRRARCATSARPTSPAGTSPHAQEAAGQPALPRPRLRAVHLQPADPARRAGGGPGRAAATASASSRGRRCTAGCSPGALRKQAEGTAAPVRSRAGRPRRSSEHRRGDRGVREALRRPRRGPGQRGPGLAAVPARA